ncbi:MAG: amino acid permease [Gemmataceae bacterium]
MTQPSEQFYSKSTDANEAASPRSSEGDTPDTARGALGLWDAVSIIVGIVVGAGIYQTAPFILKNISNPTTAMITWAVGGLLSLIGALCYAELATTYPRDGGDIVYLSRAFGNWVGFLFGWVQLSVILTGSIGMMAFVFANYAARLWTGDSTTDLGPAATFGFAGGAVFVLTVTNILGVVFGKVVQNVLTFAKVIGLGAIILAGFYAPHPGAWSEQGLPLDDLKQLTFPFFTPSLGVALVLILYTYGGWNDAAFVAAEVRDGKKNITRSLIIGIVLITVLYMLVNAAYISGLGYQGAQRSRQVAADVLNHGFGKYGETTMCVLVMISALGAINGLIFTGARVYSTIGKDYRVLSWMAGWNTRNATPVPALITQGLITLGLIFLVGTGAGRDAMNTVIEFLGEKAGFSAIGFPKVEWGAKPYDAFDTLLSCTAPVFWLFFLLTGLSLFVLRERDKHIERPFKVPFYPELPIIFCLTCGYMLYSSLDYALSRGWKGGLFLLGVVPLLAGLLLYRLAPGRNTPETDSEI